MRLDLVGDGRADGGLHQFLLLAIVDRVRPGGRAGAGVTADVLKGVAGQLPEPGATNVQPPMLCDSSCAQTHSLTVG